MIKATVLIALLPLLVRANPIKPRWSAAPTDVGETTSDVYPPTGTAANTALFPDESAVGYPGVTLTGVEPAAIQTAAAYPPNTGDSSTWPLAADDAYKSSPDDNFNIFRYWGNLSPVYSVPSSFYGLEDASPLIPDTCEITQVHLLYRHGARYPTSGAAPSVFAADIHAAAANGTFAAWGDLEFLNTWTYKLGAELLTPFGRLQNFELGVAMRQQYGSLLNNFTEAGTIPVFRTESMDRMVKTAENFAAGMFGVPEYVEQVNIEIIIESEGFNNTGAPYEVCTNGDVASRGSLGTTAATDFAVNAFNETTARLQTQIEGYTLTSTDIIAMLQLCSYETDALGYSAFCKLFTQSDFENYEYYYNLEFYYNNGMGSPVAAAQGLGYLQEFVARFENQLITTGESSMNTTLDGSEVYFPTGQSIYADATHEVVILDTLTAFNLTAIFPQEPLPLQTRTDTVFRASQVVPFATHLVIQVLECSDRSPTKQMRFILNDAVLPIDQSYAGCEYDADGLCSFDTVVAALNARIDEIDFNYDCFADYTPVMGVNYNGRAPRS